MSKNSHILVSQNNYLDEIRTAAAGKGEVDWTCPKSAVAGDRVRFFVMSHGVVAEGNVMTRPVPSTGWNNRYAAEINNVTMLPVFVPLSLIHAEMPDFGWARYPQSYVSLSLDETKKLDAILAGVCGGRLSEQGNVATLWLNVDKPRKALKVHTRQGCTDEQKKGRGPLKPVGRMGENGGWLPFDNIVEVTMFAKKHWPKYGELEYCTNCAKIAPLADLAMDDDDAAHPGIEITEGLRKLRTHYMIERNTQIVKSKRQAVLKATKKLECEVCSFDFLQKYGPLGKDFCEVHHRIPLHELRKREARQTKLEDLAIVCSNCHRMLHRGSPNCYQVGDLKRLIEQVE